MKSIIWRALDWATGRTHTLDSKARRGAYPAPYRPRGQRKADADAAKHAAQTKRDRRNAKRLQDWQGDRR